MEEENRKAYSEVIEILKLVDDEEKLEKLPMEMLELLKSKVDPEYKPEISKEIPLEEQNLQEDTYKILAWITNKYWNEGMQESKISNKNKEDENIDSIKEEKIEENVTSDTEKIGENNSESKLPILYKDLKWYQKIKIRIIDFINKIFRKQTTKQDEVNT